MDTATSIAAIVIIILAFCEAIKQAGVPSRYIPLTAVGVGILAALPFGGVNFLSVASGVILGLSTTGAYSVVKTSILGISSSDSSSPTVPPTVPPATN